MNVYIDVVGNKNDQVISAILAESKKLQSLAIQTEQQILDLIGLMNKNLKIRNWESSYQ